MTPTSVTSKIPSANPWLSHKAIIRRITQEIPGVATYDLELAEPAAQKAFRFLPGQFNMLYIPGVGEIPISISAHPNSSGPVAHTIRSAGRVTQALEKLSVGSTLGLRGPFGTCWPLELWKDSDVIVVAGGIGLAPLRPAIYSLLENRAQYGRLILLAGARTPQTLLYQNEFPLWEKQGLEVHTTVDRAEAGWNGNVGAVPMLLETVLPDCKKTVLLCCGPEVMIRFTAKGAMDLNVSREQIWTTLERNMQCAVGQCGHCQLGPDFLCKDGPVFRYDRIAARLATLSL